MRETESHPWQETEGLEQGHPCTGQKNFVRAPCCDEWSPTLLLWAAGVPASPASRGRGGGVGGGASGPDEELEKLGPDEGGI